MKNYIERDIFVLRDASSVAQPIEYVQGTNTIPILLYFRDYTIPAGSTARVYIERQSTKGEYDEAIIEDNNILIDVKDTMFSEVGKNYLHVCIVKGEDTLVTFAYPVVVKKNPVPGIVTPSQNKSDFLDEYLRKIDEKIEITSQQISEATQAKEDALSYSKDAEMFAENAAEKSNISDEKASLAEEYTIMAESFTHGGTGARENEAVDNAQYFLEQAKQISQSMNGLIPMGTISFAELSLEANRVNKYMFNISDDFVTDDTFKEGAGHSFPAGTNVFRTNDGFWDCLAGSFQTPNGDTKDNATTFVTASIRTNIVSGEKHSIIFGKIAKWFSDLKTVAFTGSYSDLSNKPTAENIGAVKTGGDVANNIVNYTEATTLTELAPGEKLSDAFGKLKLTVKNVISIVKLLGSTDISKIEDGTVTGILSALNSKYDDCFTSVSNGKTLVASAITDKGVTTSSDATFETMANNITAIPVGKCIYLGTGTSFNVKTVCANNGIDYTKLTASNFIVGVSTLPALNTEQGQLGLSGWGYAYMGGFTVSKSYANGVLTISNYAQSVYIYDTVNHITKQNTTQTATCFAYLVYTG